MLITPLDTDLKMNPDKKYKQFMIKKFLEEMRGFRIYYNESLSSYWWINPSTKEWKFEMEKTGTLWWYYGWGERFKSTLALSDLEFKHLIEGYVKMTLNLGINKFVGSLHINGDTPLMDDLEINVDEYIQECLDSNKTFPSFLNTSDFTPNFDNFDIKEFYKLNDSATDEVEEIVIKSQKDIEVKSYCDQLDVLGITPASIVMDR